MATVMPRAEVALPSDSEVEVTRQFDAPRDLVYRAYTESELLQRWCSGPPGWSMPVCEMDLRVGGKYRWRWKDNEDGKEFGFEGEFRVVSPPGHIVHTQFYDPGDIGNDMGDGCLVTLSLAEKDGRTIATTRLDFYTKEARDAAVSTGMTDGMEQSYQNLDRILADAASGGEAHATA